MIRTKTIRMTWDASMVRVHTTQEAIAKAKRLGLTSFDIEEWDKATEAWKPLGAWAKGHDGRFVSIPASE